MDGHAQDQQVADPAAGAVVPVEAQEFRRRHRHVVGRRVEGPVVDRHQSLGLDLVVDEPLPSLPEGAAGHVEQHHRGGLGLARLEEGQQFEALVEGPEPAGQDDEAVGLLQQHELAGEEVPHLDEFGILGDEPVGPLLVGQADVDPDGLVTTGTLHAGGHDAGSGPGDHHPPGTRHGRGQGPGLAVGGVVGLGARRTEDGDLLALAVGLEHPEGLGHLRQCGVDHLQVDGVGAGPGQVAHRVQDGPVQAPFRRGPGPGQDGLHRRFAVGRVRPLGDRGRRGHVSGRRRARSRGRRDGRPVRTGWCAGPACARGGSPGPGRSRRPSSGRGSHRRPGRCSRR